MSKPYPNDNMASHLSSFDKLNMSGDYQTYNLGDFDLQRGRKLPDAFIAYQTLGDPSLPAVVYPTWFSGRMSFFQRPVIYLLTDRLNSNLR